jgi:pimeloyl-ACP methyl ester carboxylesterase
MALTEGSSFFDSSKRSKPYGEWNQVIMRRMMAILFILFAICFKAPLASASDLPRVERLHHCFAEPPKELSIKFNLDCGYVIVPEFHHAQSTRELKLGFMRINSGKGKDASPLFMLSGGPGQSYINSETFLLFQAPLLGRILESRDIVLLDQRGTEHSEPSLDCPALYSLPWVVAEKGLDKEKMDNLQIETLKKCISDFKAQGSNLNAYNSVESASDVNAARQALGYQKIFYYGASYGAQLGQHVMRDFPQILEGVVLDGANPLSRKSWVEDRALDAQWGIDNLTKMCDADEKCHASYNVPALLEEVLKAFGEGTQTYTFTSPDDPKLTFPVSLTKEDLVSFIYSKQGTAIGSYSLPAILWQLNKEGAKTILEILGQQAGTQIIASRNATKGDMAFLMHLAVVCSDDPVKSVDDVVTKGVSDYARIFGQNAAEMYATLCPLVEVQELPDSTDENVTVAVPTLVLAGDLDVATPSFRSKQLADSLPNSTFIVFPGRTHVQISAANLCAGAIMSQFVLDPKKSLDTGCAGNASPYSFVLPDGTMSK